MVLPESKLLGAVCHGSIFFGLPIVVPLIVYLLKKDDDFVNHHARESLTMHIISLLLGVGVGILCLLLIGFLLVVPLAILGIVYTVFAIIAIIKCLSGEYYHYPITTKYARAWFEC
ncbi:DUF4870 domain-containing protein [Desulfallas thermosapovorans]|uniref:Tic20 family protein n=1 Tax=Desulfallas thermosapovorans DSM 6562 TaxID=1121431 RepID=A0A5S4ZY10_9FIRM|nr:DUF4870 domain-containing protein [Desulfallas thermosapovorans]TYO97971.1 hypothetical protein LX24_00255 [Desulfallas thermosapovorans DSM 6562]